MSILNTNTILTASTSSSKYCWQKIYISLDWAEPHCSSLPCASPWSWCPLSPGSVGQFATCFTPYSPVHLLIHVVGVLHFHEEGARGDPLEDERVVLLQESSPLPPVKCHCGHGQPVGRLHIGRGDFAFNFVTAHQALSLLLASHQAYQQCHKGKRCYNHPCFFTGQAETGGDRKWNTINVLEYTYTRV